MDDDLKMMRVQTIRTSRQAPVKDKMMGSRLMAAAVLLACLAVACARLPRNEAERLQDEVCGDVCMRRSFCFSPAEVRCRVQGDDSAKGKPYAGACCV